MELSSESEEFDVEKSDIDEESDSKTEDEQFDWGEETDENFSQQDLKIPPPPDLKMGQFGEENSSRFGAWVQKEHNDGNRKIRGNSEKQLKQPGQSDLQLYNKIMHKKKELIVLML